MRQLSSVDYHDQIIVTQAKRAPMSSRATLRHRFRKSQHWTGERIQYSFEMIVAIHER